MAGSSFSTPGCGNDRLIESYGQSINTQTELGLWFAAEGPATAPPDVTASRADQLRQASNNTQQILGRMADMGCSLCLSRGECQGFRRPNEPATAKSAEQDWNGLVDGTPAES